MLKSEPNRIFMKELKNDLKRDAKMKAFMKRAFDFGRLFGLTSFNKM